MIKLEKTGDLGEMFDMIAEFVYEYWDGESDPFVHGQGKTIAIELGGPEKPMGCEFHDYYHVKGSDNSETSTDRIEGPPVFTQESDNDVTDSHSQLDKNKLK